MTFELDTFIAECVEARDESSPVLAMRDVLERVVRSPNDVDAALEAASASTSHGGLTSLYTSSELTILLVVWPPGVSLYPHNHGMWAANGIYRGREDNVYYRRDGSTIASTGGQRLEAGVVGLLGDDAIHSVSTPTSGWTAALHVYGGDYFAVPRSEWDATTLEERPFDVEHARQILREAEAATDLGAR